MQMFVILVLILPVVRLQQDIYNDPWTDQRAKGWFLGGNTNNVNRRDSVSDDAVYMNTKYSDNVPVVGKQIDYQNYQPSWHSQVKAMPSKEVQNIQEENEKFLSDWTGYNIGQPSDTKNIENKNAKFLFELNNNQRDKNVMYDSYPAVPSAGSFQQQQAIPSQNRQRSNSVPSQGSWVQDVDGGQFISGGDQSDFSDRQNYYDTRFGSWPTGTVNPSNINILDEPKIAPGAICPENWIYFRGSCYLLRNQELFPGELVTTLYKASWYTAKATCNALGAYLTEIESQDEQRFVEDIKIRNHVALLWTGGTDFSQDGYWTWSQSKKPMNSYQYWARPPWRQNVLGPIGRGHCMALRQQ